MSQFDFPRIHFKGTGIINPATGNNGFYLPLTFYNPSQVEVYLPPRLFVSPEFHSEEADENKVQNSLPKHAVVREDSEGRPYVEIGPVNTREVFRQWVVQPLGTSKTDQDFHDLYKLLKGRKSNRPISGAVPAYWNYYGDMTFKLHRTHVFQVEVVDEQVIEKHSQPTGTCPDDVAAILGSRVFLRDNFGNESAVMIDVTPTMALYSQVFCDRLVVSDSSGTELLNGSPTKGSVRQLNTHRIVNQPDILGTSGTIYTVIDFEKDKQSRESPLAQFLLNRTGSHRELKGIHIRYNLHRVFENQDPDYSAEEHLSNPARCELIGTIAPWLESDLKSVSASRWLAADKAFIKAKGLQHVLCSVNPEQQLISLDLSASYPQENLSLAKETRSFPDDYKILDLGLISLKFTTDSGVESVVGQFEMNESLFHLKDGTCPSGIMDFQIDSSAWEDFSKGEFLLSKIDQTSGDEVVLSRELRYVVTTDQPGAYSNQGDDPGKGYRANTGDYEPIILRVFSRGSPYGGPVPVHLMILEEENGMPFLQIDEELFESYKEVRDGDALLLPANRATNRIYFFSTSPLPNLSPAILADIAHSGSYISHRVLPDKEYSRYLSGAAKVSFQVIYDEILSLFDLIYPISSVISPFNEKYITKSIPFLMKLMDDSNWASATYMPSSRELTRKQLQLLRTWAKQAGHE